MSVDLERSLCAHMVFVGWLIVLEEYFIFTQHFLLTTLRALVQTCSDRTRCSVPFSSMNYRQRPRSPQPQQPTSQTQQKLTELVVFWKHDLLCSWIITIADIQICSSWREWFGVIILWIKTSSNNNIQVEKKEKMSYMRWTYLRERLNFIAIG